MIELLVPFYLLSIRSAKSINMRGDGSGVQSCSSWVKHDTDLVDCYIILYLLEKVTVDDRKQEHHKVDESGKQPCVKCFRMWDYSGLKYS